MVFPIALLGVNQAASWATPPSPTSAQGSVKRVDFYDQGRTAVALVMIAGREQQLVCDLPGRSGETPLFLETRKR